MGIPESQYKKTKTLQPKNQLEFKKQNIHYLINDHKQNLGKIIEKFKTAFANSDNLTTTKNAINNKFQKTIKNTIEDTEICQNSSTIKNFEISDSLNDGKGVTLNEQENNKMNDKKLFRTKNAIKISRKFVKKEYFEYSSDIKNTNNSLDYYDDWDTDNIVNFKSKNKYEKNKKIKLDNNRKDEEIQNNLNTNLKICNIINEQKNENLLEKTDKNMEEDIKIDYCSDKEDKSRFNSSDSSNLMNKKIMEKNNNVDDYPSSSDYNSNDRLCPNANYRVGEKISDEYRSESESYNKSGLNKEEIKNYTQNSKNTKVKEMENNGKKNENNDDGNFNSKKEDDIKKSGNINNIINGDSKINDIDEKEFKLIKNEKCEDNIVVDKNHNSNQQNLNEDNDSKDNDVEIKKNILNEKECLNDCKKRSDCLKNSSNLNSIEKKKMKEKLINNNKTDQNAMEKNRNNINETNRNHSKNISKKNIINKKLTNKFKAKKIQKDIFIKTIREIFEKIKNDDKKKHNLIKNNTIRNTFRAETAINNFRNKNIFKKRKIQRSMFSNSLLRYLKTETSDPVNKNRNIYNEQKKKIFSLHKARTTFRDYNNDILYKKRKFNRTNNNSKRNNPFIHPNLNDKKKTKSNSNKQANYSMEIKRINIKRELNRNLTNIKTETQNKKKLKKKYLDIDLYKNPHLNKTNLKFIFDLDKNISYQHSNNENQHYENNNIHNNNNKIIHKKVNLHKKYSQENSTRNSEKYNSSSKSKNFRLVMNRNISFLERKKKQREVSDHYYKKSSNPITSEFSSLKNKFETNLFKNTPHGKNKNNYIDLERKTDKIAIDKARLFMKKIDRSHVVSRNKLKKEFIKMDFIKSSNVLKRLKNENILKEIEKLSNKKNIKVELSLNLEKNISCNNKINHKLFNFSNKNNDISKYNILEKMNDNTVIYEGIVYRIIKKENKIKLNPRYFQITKNSFKYFSGLKRLKVADEKPLVQLDIGFIKRSEVLDLNYIDQNIIKEYKIQLIFRIILTNNNESFIFATDKIKLGDDCVSILNLLVQFYKN